jgi:hypothetical protein
MAAAMARSALFLVCCRRAPWREAWRALRPTVCMYCSMSMRLARSGEKPIIAIAGGQFRVNGTIWKVIHSDQHSPFYPYLYHEDEETDRACRSESVRHLQLLGW